MGHVYTHSNNRIVFMAIRFVRVIKQTPWRSGALQKTCVKWELSSNSMFLLPFDSHSLIDDNVTVDSYD